MIGIVEWLRKEAELIALDRLAEAADEIERLRAALEPFARNVDAISLRDTLGHITREDLWRARAALEPKP